MSTASLSSRQLVLLGAAGTIGFEAVMFMLGGDRQFSLTSMAIEFASITGGLAAGAYWIIPMVDKYE